MNDIRHDLQKILNINDGLDRHFVKTENSDIIRFLNKYESVVRILNQRLESHGKVDIYIFHSICSKYILPNYVNDFDYSRINLNIMALTKSKNNKEILSLFKEIEDKINEEISRVFEEKIQESVKDIYVLSYTKTILEFTHINIQRIGKSNEEIDEIYNKTTNSISNVIVDILSTDIFKMY